jgi:hypothetical protein
MACAPLVHTLACVAPLPATVALLVCINVARGEALEAGPVSATSSDEIYQIAFTAEAELLICILNIPSTLTLVGMPFVQVTVTADVPGFVAL